MKGAKDCEVGHMKHVDLCEDVVARILLFVAEPRARLCCRVWDGHLYESLQLEHRIRFYKPVRSNGSVDCYLRLTRAYADFLEECLSYQIKFLQDGTYTLSWDRCVGDCFAAEGHYAGKYRVVDDQIECQLLESAPSTCDSFRAVEQECIFQLPVDVALSEEPDQIGNSSWENQLRQLTMRSAVVAPPSKPKAEGTDRNRVDHVWAYARFLLWCLPSSEMPRQANK